jgi:hypothetical protein
MKVEMELPTDFNGQAVVVQQVLTDDPVPCWTDDKCPADARWAVFFYDRDEDPRGVVAMTACNEHVCDLLWLVTQPASVPAKRVRLRMLRRGGR